MPPAKAAPRRADATGVVDLLPENRAALEAHHPALLARLETTAPAPLPPPSEPLASLRCRQDVTRTRFMVAFGVGSGIELAEAVRLRPDRYFVVIEPRIDALAAALSAVDLSAALSHPEGTWWVQEPTERLQAILRPYCTQAKFVFFAKAFCKLRPSPVDEDHARTLVEAEAAFDAAAEAGLVVVGNDTDDALTGLECITGNRQTIARSPTVNALRGALAGHPAVVASAGPSLARSLPELRALPEGVAVFCPDTSQRILLDAGIRPHVVASRERKLVTVRHFEDVDSEGVALVCPPVLRPRIFELHRGPVGFVYRTMDMPAWLEIDEPNFEFTGSAGNLAFLLAALAGCDPIVLVGQDLCFGEDGETHAPGTATGSRQSADYDRATAIPVRGNRRETVWTSPKWKYFLETFEVDLADHPGRVLNATEGGARIRGADPATLAELLPGLAGARDPRPKIAEALRPRPEAERARRLDRLERRCADTRAMLDELLAIADVGKKFADKALAELRPPRAERPDLSLLLAEDPYRILEGVRNKLITAHYDLFVAFLEPLTQPAFLALEMERYRCEARAGTPRELGRQTLELYRRGFVEMADIMRRAGALLPGDAARPDRRRHGATKSGSGKRSKKAGKKRRAS